MHFDPQLGQVALQEEGCLERLLEFTLDMDLDRTIDLGLGLRQVVLGFI
jgi:hypothetical protein